MKTDLSVNSKKETISQGCKACGFHGLLQFNHKLNTYIIKNPPNMNPGTQGASLTEGKRARRSKAKQNGETTTNGERSGSPKSEEEPELIVAPTKPIKEDVDDDWAVDVSEEAVRARLQDLTDGAKNLTMTDDLEKTEKERMDIFYGTVKQRKDSGTLEVPSAAKELFAEAERLEIKSKAPLVLAELLFDEKIHIQIKRHRILFLRFTHDDPKAQKALIGGVEQIVAMHKTTLLPKVPAIFKLLYDLDILEENVIMEWGGKVSKKYVPKELSQEIHNKAEPFLTWLKEAEEEEESTDEEDDLEIEYNDRLKASPLKEHKPVNTPKPSAPPVEDDEEDDVDIDAI
uniref:Eukaryotic translation initiation factor 5 n=1 Tax=Triatoma infestans TaxID=30076 RepID=A0A171A8G6_TRIIF